METATPISPKETYLVGQFCVNNEPEKAREYISFYNTQKQKALDNDPSNLNYYFLNYCKKKGLTSIDEALALLGALGKKEKVDTRRLFIATMVRIYKPQILFSPICAENGIGQGLCNIMRVDNGNMSKTIDEIKAWFNSKTDADFRDSVNDMAQNLTDVKKGYVDSMFKMAS